MTKVFIDMKLGDAIVIFIESLRNLERIGDHADNLGISVMRSD